MSGPRISLDQWQALIAVVETGSYSNAAERLHKTQSTISYGIKKIESQLGVKVFQIAGRKAVLTEPGLMLYRRGRALVDEAERVERSAASLAAGWAPEFRIAVEILFPTWLMLECIERFNAQHPHIRVELYETVLDGTNELLLEGRVDMAITSLVPSGFLGDALLHVRAIAVAAPDHPLHQLDRPLAMDDLRSHRHVLIRDSGTTRTRTPAWQGAEQRLTVSHKASSIRALCMGLGFAWFAEESIREELATGRLKPLPLKEGAERWGTLHLVHPDPDALSPSALLFDQLVREGIRDCPDQAKQV